MRGPQRLAGVWALAACLLLGCPAAHPSADGGLDAGSDGGELAPCDSRAAWSFVNELCNRLWLPDLAPDGMPIWMRDGFAPLAVEVDGSELIVTGLLAHRPRPPFLGGPSTDLLAARVRYRVRLDGPTPFGAMEEAVAIEPALAVEEILRAGEEMGCERVDTLGHGRLLCTSNGEWDVWAHPHVQVHADPSWHLPVESYTRSVVLVSHRDQRLYWLDLQGLPESCEHDPAVLPTEPCRPLLEPGGAHTNFAVASGTLDRGELVDLEPWSFPTCGLEPTCLPCCDRERPPTEYSCWNQGFQRCDENAAWHTAACAATTLAEVPAPPVAPCRPSDDEWFVSACGPWGGDWLGGERPGACF